MYISQTVLPYEWAYGVLLRAAEIADDPEFALCLWKGTSKLLQVVFFVANFDMFFKDMRFFNVPINNADTLERVCGAFSSGSIASNVSFCQYLSLSQ